MMRHDIVNHQTTRQIECLSHKKTKSSAQSVIAANRAALDSAPLQRFTDEEIKNAKDVLAQEMEYVKGRMGHGELTIQAYSKVWEECYAQVNSVRVRINSL